MAIVFLYVTGKFTAYPGDVRTTRVSLAIRLTDDFTNEEPKGNIKMSIHEGERKRDDIKIIKNLSGYYVMNDLVAGDYTVGIESDYYFTEKIPVKIKASIITN